MNVKWIKLSTQMFEDEKIRLIENMPEADTILVCWFKLFLMSSKDGSFKVKNFANNTHSTEELLSVLLKKDIQFIWRMISALTEVGVMKIDGDTIEINRFWRTNQELRNSPEYKLWRADVFERDKYTCQMCNQVGGSLNAHHIKSFACYEELRFEVSNGQTLCEPCHRKVHKKGEKNG
ncbi:phage replisome organizer N-terminal domain-containing protein [Bacillus sp. FSL K6-3431]|uniref:phage replisome organizer N-terminal domain-containing protein n=1 Tax=Bacillus sp. FSL K6-3431 TaxID=2921500 RepID=UPI004046A4E9